MFPLRSLCLLLTLASPALAAPCLPAICPPSVDNSTIPSCISLVGATGGTAAAVGEFTIILRDLANNPMAGASVVIDFSACPDAFICAEQLDPAATANCAHKTVRKVTAADGSARFTVLGGSNGAGNATTLLNGGRIYANGTLIQSPTVSAYDLDGAGGVGANDLSAWLGDFASGQNFGRSDYDCSGSIGANDFSLWLGVFASGTMVESCASVCP